METTELLSKYEKLSNDDLTLIVQEDYDLTDAIMTHNPHMAQDAGFELFDSNWAKRYWRNILAEVRGIGIGDEVYKWAIGTSVASIAKLLISHYALPAAAFSAVVALVIVLIRAAKSEKEKK